MHNDDQKRKIIWTKNEQTLIQIKRVYFAFLIDIDICAHTREGTAFFQHTAQTNTVCVWH